VHKRNPRHIIAAVRRLEGHPIGGTCQPVPRIRLGGVKQDVGHPKRGVAQRHYNLRFTRLDLGKQSLKVVGACFCHDSVFASWDGSKGARRQTYGTGKGLVSVMNAGGLTSVEASLIKTVGNARLVVGDSERLQDVLANPRARGAV
jgi:hypothetical protein